MHSDILLPPGFRRGPVIYIQCVVLRCSSRRIWQIVYGAMSVVGAGCARWNVERGFWAALLAGRRFIEAGVRGTLVPAVRNAAEPLSGNLGV